MARLSVLDLRGDRSDPRDRLPRPRVDLSAAREGVDATLKEVAAHGDEALRSLTVRFDDVEVEDLVVPKEVLDHSLGGLDPELRAALERAAEQVRWFHERARPRDWQDTRDGAVMGQWHRPVQRAGVYVPGGKAAYPSTVIMTVVPAQVAGVGLSEANTSEWKNSPIHIDDTPWPNGKKRTALRFNAIDIKTEPGALVFLTPAETRRLQLRRRTSIES